jgi:hypothetical protein
VGLVDPVVLYPFLRALDTECSGCRQGDGGGGGGGLPAACRNLCCVLLTAVFAVFLPEVQTVFSLVGGLFGR